MVLVLPLLLAAPPAAAVLVPDPAGERVEVELADALAARGVATVDLFERFTGPALPDRGTSRLLAGKKAFDDLDYEAAATELQAALSAWTDAPTTATARGMAEAHFLLGVLAAQGGPARARDAERELGLALALDPSMQVDPSVYGERAHQLSERARVAMRAARPVRLEVDASVGGAQVSVDGSAPSRTPPAATLEVRPGQHLLFARRPGYLPAARVLTVTAGTGPVRLELTPAPGLVELKRALAALPREGRTVPAGAGAVASSIPARYLVVAAVDGERARVEVWDTVDGHRLRGLTTPLAGPHHEVAAAVAGFIARPTPLAGDAAVAATGPVYTRWWFWTAVGAAVAGGVAAGVVMATQDRPRPFNTTLGLP